jgi:hypothetical protein
MAIKTTDAAIFYNCEEIVEVILGKSRALLQKITESDHWESLLEDLNSPVEYNPKTLEEIEETFENREGNLRLSIIRDVEFKDRY